MPRRGPGTQEVLVYKERSLTGGPEKPEPGSQHYLFSSRGAALRTLHGAPLGTSVLLGDTPGHVHVVVQKHLLPHAAYQLLLLRLGHNLLHAAFTAAATVGQVPRGTAVSAVRGQNACSKEVRADNTDREKDCRVMKCSANTTGSR